MADMFAVDPVGLMVGARLVGKDGVSARMVVGATDQGGDRSTLNFPRLTGQLRHEVVAAPIAVPELTIAPPTILELAEDFATGDSLLLEEEKFLVKQRHRQPRPLNEISWQ